MKIKAFASMVAVAAMTMVSLPSLAHRRVVTVDQMTCPQAQAYAAQYGRYYKRASGQVIPIYGFVTSRNSCGFRYVAYPLLERTADGRRCVVAYRCYERIND